MYDASLVTIHFHWKEKSTMNILHLSFCGLQKKESHTSLKQHDNKEIMPEFLFLEGLYL